MGSVYCAQHNQFHVPDIFQYMYRRVHGYIAKSTDMYPDVPDMYPNVYGFGQRRGVGTYGYTPL